MLELGKVLVKSARDAEITFKRKGVRLPQALWSNELKEVNESMIK